MSSPCDTVANKFPSKLWRIVNNCITGAIRWGDEGRTIIIHQKNFQREFLDPSNNLFKTKNMGSFIRQLNLYGFRKLNGLRYNRDFQQLPHLPIEIKTPEWHEFQNDFFVQNRPDLLQRIRRNVGVRRSREAAAKQNLAQACQNGTKQPTYQHGYTQLMWAVPIHTDNTYSFAQAKPVYAHWDSQRGTWNVPGINTPAIPSEGDSTLSPGTTDNRFSLPNSLMGDDQPAPLIEQGSEDFPVLHIPDHGTTVLTKDDFDKLVNAIADALKNNPETWSAISKQVELAEKQGVGLGNDLDFLQNEDFDLESTCSSSTDASEISVSPPCTESFPFLIDPVHLPEHSQLSTSKPAVLPDSTTLNDVVDGDLLGLPSMHSQREQQIFTPPTSDAISMNEIPSQNVDAHHYRKRTSGVYVGNSSNPVPPQYSNKMLPECYHAANHYSQYVASNMHQPQPFKFSNGLMPQANQIYRHRNGIFDQHLRPAVPVCVTLTRPQRRLVDRVHMGTTYYRPVLIHPRTNTFSANLTHTKTTRDS